jgi:CRISPR/Cas system-associated endonuclease Cas1
LRQLLSRSNACAHTLASWLIKKRSIAIIRARKIEGQNIVLKKDNLKTDTSVKLKIDALETGNLALLRRLTQIEDKFSQFYFKQILQLIPERIRPEDRKTFKAYDGVNNLFNLAYELLAWKAHRALINAKFEPYLGFLHSERALS